MTARTKERGIVASILTAFTYRLGLAFGLGLVLGLGLANPS